MGMDLIALQPSSQEYASYHMNWSGWRVFINILDELGCNLSQASGSNDGATVDKETSEKWGIALGNNLDKIIIEKVKDESVYGGYKSNYRLLSDEEFNSQNTSQSYLETLNHARKNITLLSDDEEDFNWLNSIVKFLKYSGGFEQY